MRLLNTTTCLLHDFPLSDLPCYAIFSHTWGAIEIEVSYLDVCRGVADKKEGYQKIEYTCDQAVLDGLQWIWVDTCCIDKSSSAELSEAINSMFDWYLHAMICYTYLADVPASVDTHRLDSEFARSRWFTRGWTLQELIAPSHLIFFSHDWVQLGDKSTLYETLSKITGIDVNILSGIP